MRFIALLLNDCILAIWLHLVCRTWDDGTTVPEPCLDDYTQVTPRYALTWLAGGLLSFAALGALTTASHPESRRPFVKEKQLVYVPKESPGL